MLGRMHATSGCAAVAVARSRGRALKQESVPTVSVRVTSQWCAQEAADQAARTPHGLLVANMVDDHHEGVLHAAFAALSAPRV
jgi:hypothetical protein